MYVIVSGERNKVTIRIFNMGRVTINNNETIKNTYQNVRCHGPYPSLSMESNLFYHDGSVRVLTTLWPQLHFTLGYFLHPFEKSVSGHCVVVDRFHPQNPDLLLPRKLHTYSFLKKGSIPVRSRSTSLAYTIPPF